MKNKNVDRIMNSLKLEKEIVGVKFIDYKKEFDNLSIERAEKKGPFCYLAREAMDGNIFKADESDITCDYARYALGVTKPHNSIKEGRSYCHAGLYESNAIAKDIVESMKYSDHRIHGVVLGPLRLMEDADIVIVAGYSETIMRVMQGYAYKFGNPKNLSFFGNQAMCADLVSKPYKNNDINMSLMCKGTRVYGRFNKGEIAVGLPISMFDDLADGIVKTINPVNNSKEKKDIAESLKGDEDLVKSIDYDYNYGARLKEYDEIIEKNY